MPSQPTTPAWSFTTNGPPRAVLSRSPIPLPVFPPSPPPLEEYILIATSYAALNPGDLFTTHLIPSFVRSTPTVSGLDLVGTVCAESCGPGGLVVGVCSGGGERLVRELGAGEVVDYTAHDNVSWELATRYGEQKFDAVVDAVGADMRIYTRCAKYLKLDGVYSSVKVKLGGFGVLNAVSAVWKVQMNALWPQTPWLLGNGRTWKARIMMDPGVELMERVVGMLAEGKLKVVVDSEWTFDQVLQAYEVVISGRAKGKVIIKVGDEDNR